MLSASKKKTSTCPTCGDSFSHYGARNLLLKEMHARRGCLDMECHALEFTAFGAE